MAADASNAPQTARTSAPALRAVLLPGAERLLAEHARELPQRDDLCGAFCGSLALLAAGLGGPAGEPLDQDAVALAAGSLVGSVAAPEILPFGERGRRDYRLELPRIGDGTRSGTTAAGVAAAIEELSDGRLEAIALAGPWSEAALAGVFDAAAALSLPAALIANHHTSYLWGTRTPVARVLEHLLSGADEGPAPDWEVGHFALLVGRVEGPAASVYMLADTYRSLGSEGLHVQPGARVAASLERREHPAGGVIAAVHAQDAPAFRSAVSAAGVREGLWDNGTPTTA